MTGTFAVRRPARAAAALEHRPSSWVRQALRLAAAAGALLAGAAAGQSTADHQKFKELQVTFDSGPQVTRACLGCHTEAARQIMKTKHWTMETLNPNFGQVLGKRQLANNFCIGIASNWAYCTSCHVGYGWKDHSFDFKAEENVDCLVCHDTTGTYRKPSGLAGHPVYREMEFPPGSGEILRPVDLQKVARRVGKTSRYTCGACHFLGGGGDGVKHGDLDTSLNAPERDVDVHMEVLGNDFTCATCHMTTGHQVPGSRYAVTAKDRGGAHLRGKADRSNPVTCEACHGNRPHSAETLAKHRPLPGFTRSGLAAIVNNHTEKLACETCHVPAMARGGVPTKLSWDWSAAGRRGPDGKPLVLRDDQGRVTYDAKKGAYTLGENVVPDYVWFNGSTRWIAYGDRIDAAAAPVRLNRFEGDPADGSSRIWPIKVFRGVQPYDPVLGTLVIPHTYGTDDNAYARHFDWNRAIAAGMAEAGLPYSGSFAFVRTESLWPLTHMVAPRERTVACPECHDARGSLARGRLKDVPGLRRIPPRDMGY